jgi:hypothetical protein
VASEPRCKWDLLANPNLQRGEAALHRKKTDLLFQQIQLMRQAQELKIIELENSPEAQVGAVTFLDSESTQVKTKFGKSAKEKESRRLKLIFKYHKFQLAWI